MPTDGVEDDSVRRLHKTLATEIAVSAQAVDLAEPLRLGGGTELAHDLVRGELPPLDEGRALAADVEALDSVMSATGRLVSATRLLLDQILGASDSSINGEKCHRASIELPITLVARLLELRPRNLSESQMVDCELVCCGSARNRLPDCAA